MHIDPDAVQDAERWPGLNAMGAAVIAFMRDHPHAPIWRNASGHRLLPEEWAPLRRYEADVLHAPLHNDPQHEPVWLQAFVRRVHAQVPWWRNRVWPAGAGLEDLPTPTRADLSADITAFVPDDVPLQRLINFSTSGTTGHPLLIPSHPVVAARYRAFHQRAMARLGIHLQAGAGTVGIVLLGWQQRCFTYVSVTPVQAQSGLAKINLHPHDWRDPGHRALYLDALQAEVYAGDPLSFAALLELPVRHRPRVLMSTSMTLLPGLRAALEARFAAPVLDLYSMNEAGPVAVADPALQGHVLLQPGLYVEILDPQGRRVPLGVRGEITLSGGFNFCLPLLRYRTGDHASLHAAGQEWVLRDLSGRPPVRFRRMDGTAFNNVELTHVLKPLALAQWQIIQQRDGQVRVRLPTLEAATLERVSTALQGCFGSAARLHFELLPNDGQKVIQYLSEWPLEGVPARQPPRS